MKSLTEKFYNKEELTVKERKSINAGDIRINRIKCLKCGDIITSNHRHDFKYCKCGNCAVDGGSWYCGRIGDNWEDLSVLYKEQLNKNGK